MRKVYQRTKKQLKAKLIFMVLLLSVVSVNPAFSQGDSLLFHWDFVDQGDNIVHDVSGNGINTDAAQIRYGTFVNDGYIGEGFSIDNASAGDYVWNAPYRDATTLATTNEITIMGWFYQQGAVNGINGGISKQDEWSLNVADGSDNNHAKYVFLIKTDAGQKSVETSAEVTTNTWHHIAVTYDSDTIKIYFDGVKAFTEDYSSTSIDNSSSRLFCGARYSNGECFNGKFDEVKVFDEALTAAQILEESLHRPKITASTPVSGATDVSIHDDFSFTFSEPMDESSVTVSGSPALSNPVKTWADNTLTVAHDALTLSTAYAITITGDDTGGTAMNDTIISFTTTSTSDVTPPTILSTSPDDGFVGVREFDPIIITFDEAMNEGTVTVTGTGLTGVAYSWSGNTVTVSHDDFSKATDYTLTVTGEDISGNDLVAYNFSFRTFEMLLHWSFEEGTGTTTADLSGNGNNGDLKGDAAWATPSFDGSGGCMEFFGTGTWGDNVRRTNPTDTSKYAVTMMAWMYPDPTLPDFQYGSGISKGNSWAITIREGSDASHVKWKAEFDKESGGNAYLTAAEETAIKEWHHIAATYDGTTIKIYIDGVLSAEDNTNAGFKLANGDHIRAGSAGGKNFGGKQDEVKWYNGSLTAAEIAKEYFGSAISKTWTGTTDSDWSTAANWDPTGVPGTSDIVLIPSTVTSGNWPIVSTAVTIDSVILNSSSKLATGSLIISSGSLTTNGAIIKRFIDKENWHIVSSPVTGQDQKSFGADNGLSIYAAQSEYDLATYDEAGGDWAGWIKTDGTNSSNFGTGMGYLTRLSQGELGRAVSFAGSSVSSGTVSVTITQSANGWNSVGNPYTSSVRANGTNSFLSVNGSELDATYGGLYFWNQITADYQIVSNADAETNIALGQGFIVKSKTGGATLTFNTTMQVHASTDSLKSAEIKNPEIELSVIAGKNKNNTRIILLNGATEDMDPGYDIGKYKGNPKIALFSKLVSNTSNVDFGLQCLPLTGSNSYRIPIGLELSEDAEVTFTAKSINLKENMQVILEDTLNNSFTVLGTEDAKYTTTVSSSELKSGRFFLHTSNAATSADNIGNVQKFKVYTRKKLIFVETENADISKIQLFGIEGKLFYQSQSINSNTTKIDASGFPVGIYLVVVKSSNSIQTQKIVLSN